MALEYFSRASDIQFVSEKINVSKKIKGTTSVCASDPSTWNNIELLWRVWSYSGIGHGTDFECNFGKGIFQTLEEKKAGEKNEAKKATEKKMKTKIGP
jgi:hypothetical protein